MTVKNTLLKLFFCPSCSQNVELKTKDEYKQHFSLCNRSQMAPSVSIETNEATMPLAKETHKSCLNDERPVPTYSKMILEALNRAEDGLLSLRDIKTYITHRHPLFRDMMEVKGFQNAIMNILTSSPMFYQVPRSRYWAMKDKDQMQISEHLDIAAQSPKIVRESEETDTLDMIKCDMCEFKLECKVRQNLRVKMSHHYSEAHSIQNVKICKTKGCQFRTQSHLVMKYHKRKEAGNVQCEICGKSISSSNFKSHMRTHSDLTIDCEYCFRPYGSSCMLK